MILLYHSVFRDHDQPLYWKAGQPITFSVFKHQIKWLERRYRFVSLDEYLAVYHHREVDKRKRIALTFDDGYQKTFDCVSPFLIKNDIPATFFVSSGHLEHGELLWFSYLNALCFESHYTSLNIDQQDLSLQTIAGRRSAINTLANKAKFSGDPGLFCQNLAAMYPIPPKVISNYEGMTFEQLKQVGKSKLLDVGGHTVTHPFLNLLEKEKQIDEITKNKEQLSNLLGKQVRYFAYPSGEYNSDTIDAVKVAGFEAAFAVIPKNIERISRFEFERIGVYSHSLLKLYMKVIGIALLARKFGLQVG